MKPTITDTPLCDNNLKNSNGTKTHDAVVPPHTATQSRSTTEIRGKIIHTLRAVDSISGEALAGELGFSRVALWKHIEALRAMGYPIEGGRGGYSLAGAVAEKQEVDADVADSDSATAPVTATENAVATDLATEVDPSDFLYPWEFGELQDRIWYFSECGSTMNEAEKLVRGDADAPDGTLVLAGVQTKGRGRLGRVWESEAGGIYATLIVRPENLPLQEFWTMQWKLIIAVVRAVRGLGVDASIKWPNDLLVGTKKVTGVIAETRSSGGLVEWGLLGFGINCNNPVPEVGVSLAKLCGHTIDRKALIKEILTIFAEVRTLSPAELTDQWRAYTSTLGREVTIDMGGDRIIRGIAKEVFSDGSLLVVDTDGKEQRCYSGDCLY